VAVKLRGAASFIPALLVTGVILFLATQSPGSQVIRDFPLPGKPGHLAGYFTLAAAAYWGFRGRRLLGGPWAGAALASFLWVLWVAFTDEFLQGFTPGRVSSIWDVFIDAGGAGAALLLLRLKKEC
jgi:VanZ family protein